jgi:large repetitive protein
MKKWIGMLGIICLVMAGAILGGGLSFEAQAATGPWPVYGHDARHTGVSAYQGPSAPVATQWSFPVSKSGSSSVLGPDGTIYMGTSSGVYAMNPDGTVKWTFIGDPDITINSTPAVASDGTIYVGIGNDLYAINPDGTEKWRESTGGLVLSSPMLSSNGTIYVGSNDGYVYAIDSHAADPAARLKWKSAFVGSVGYNAPAISPDGDTVYITSRYLSDSTVGAIAAIDAGTGLVDWQVPTPGGIVFQSSPAVGTDGTIYFGSRNTYIYALNPDGSEKWSFKTSGWIDATPTLGNDGTIYVGSADKNLYALNSDGSLKWKFATAGQVRAMAAMGSDGTLYVGDSNTRLYAVNPDGTENWSLSLLGGYGILDTPIIGTDGTLYVGTYWINGRVYAIGPKPDPYLGQCVFQNPQAPNYYIDDYDEGQDWGTGNTYFNVVWNGDLIYDLIPIASADSYGRPYWESGGYRYTRGAWMDYEAEWGTTNWQVCKTAAGTPAPAP